MDVELFNYSLPKELIAQKPFIPRDSCRLMVINRSKNSIEHKTFKDIKSYLRKRDLLILNDTKVMPARIFAKKETGGKLEIFLLEEIEKNRYLCLTKGRVKNADKVYLKNGIEAAIETTNSDKRLVTFHIKDDIKKQLNSVGEVPLPPYIHRNYESYDKQKDFKYYQTVYAKKEGAVAAPTAGLHFSEKLIKEINDAGVNIAYITLHVGIGTFRPVKEKAVEEHKMHEETYEIDKQTAFLYNETKQKGNRVIAVGTTVIRALESAVGTDGFLKPAKGSTDIFIYPGYKYKAVDAMITNFHLPKSTLIMLVSAFYSRKDILNCYNEAIRKRYRFFSFGDAMFIY